VANKNHIGFWSVVAIGVGGMVGGGIFAVLGLAVQLAHGGTPVGFLIGGMVALITSYSYARLSVKYPSRGGTVEFLNQAFGTGLMTGGLNILLWLSYIVMLSLYAYAFGSYGISLFPESYRTVLLKHLLISFVLLSLTGLNIFGSNVIGKFEEWIVAFKISILLLFIGVGIWSIQGASLYPSSWSSPLWLITGSMIIFLAYEGFELIANTAA
jgi:amino acid transporter